LKDDYAYAYIVKGNLLYITQKYNIAIQCFDKAIELKSDDPDIYLNKANCLFRLKQYNQAIDIMSKQ
jgi:tetratricopeptide (TPR) repeat protein